MKTGQEWVEEFADKGWVWGHQGRSYAHTYGIDIVRWTVLHYRGYYQGPVPVCKQYLVRFSGKEQQQTWDMLRKNRDVAMQWKAEQEKSA